jgi:nicotinamide-nucleotide amidase
MPAPTAEIIAVGSELLTPYRLDTNSLFLTSRLNDAGIRMVGKCVVGDDPRALGDRVRAALDRVDVLILTGGLGPTADDITREVVASVLDRALAEDPDALDAIRERFTRRRMTMPEINRRQAMVPAGAIVLANPNGTAPGLLIEDRGRLVVLLPGPPRELQPMFEAGVFERLRALAPDAVLRRRIIRIAGRAESEVDQVAEPIYAKLTTPAVDVETTILAAAGQIELHLTGTGVDAREIDRVLDEGVEQLASALAPAVISVDGRRIEEVVGAVLQARQWRIAAAESCTGGLLLEGLTEIPGSSAWVNGGVIAYADAVKVDVLGVPADLIATHGAVSEPVALAMVDGVCAKLRAEVGVAITGIAGPGGGTPEKPVGTVVIAVRTPERNVVKTLAFAGDRQTIRIRSVATALDLVRRLAG